MFLSQIDFLICGFFNFDIYCFSFSAFLFLSIYIFIRSLNGSPKENLSANSALSSGRKETSNECTVPTLSQANKEDRLLKMLHNSICRDISNMFQVSNHVPVLYDLMVVNSISRNMQAVQLDI